MTDSIKVKYLNSTDCTPVQSNQAKKERKKKRTSNGKKEKELYLRTLFQFGTQFSPKSSLIAN